MNHVLKSWQGTTRTAMNTKSPKPARLLAEKSIGRQPFNAKSLGSTERGQLHSTGNNRNFANGQQRQELVLCKICKLKVNDIFLSIFKVVQALLMVFLVLKEEIVGRRPTESEYNKGRGNSLAEPLACMRRDGIQFTPQPQEV